MLIPEGSIETRKLSSNLKEGTEKDSHIDIVREWSKFPILLSI